MRLKTLQVSALFLIFLASVCLAQVHAGLKSAVDARDFSKAISIINNFGVTDVYCPASLTVDDIEMLYGKAIAEKPELLTANCTPELAQEYLSGACGDKNKVVLCKRILNSKPVGQWGTYLEVIKKNGLESIEVDSVEMIYASSQPEKECRKMIERDNCLREYCNLGGDCVAMAKQELQLCISGNHEWIESCMNGDYPKVQSIKKVSTAPFSNYFTLFNQHAVQKTQSLLNYSKIDEQNTALLKTFTSINRDDKLISLLKEEYKKNSYISDSVVVHACRLNENIDNQINLEIGFELFSCEIALGRYNPDNIPACTSNDENKRFKTESLMDGSPSLNFVCRNQKWEFTTDTLPVAEPAKDTTKIEPTIPTPQEIAKKDTVAPEQKVPANVDTTKHNIHWVPIGISAAVLVGGAILAIVENAEAKSLSETKIKDVKQLKKTKEDIDGAQTMRAVGIGIAALGAVGLGLSILF